MKSKIDFAVGGQALIEGILMRSPNFNIIAVRDPQGKIIQKSDQYQNITRRIKLLNIPILRGVINMLEMMLIGTKALNFSSLISLSETPQHDEASEQKVSFLGNLSVLFSLAFGLGLAILLFKFVPLWITDTLSHQWKVIDQNYLIYNLLDGVIKTILFVAYIALMSQLPDIKRVFRYHGAEHKSIMTYEKGLELTVENARSQTRFHPRCGTSFILIVFLISIFVFTLIPRNPDFLINFGLRLSLLPLIAGISYEFLKMSARFQDNFLLSCVSAPGLLMQRLTTQEPDDQMLEVALTSLKTALSKESELNIDPL